MPHSQDELVEAVLRDDLGAVEAFLRADSERAARVVSQSICDWPLVSRAPSLPMAQKLVEFGADPRSVGPIWSSGLSVNPQVDRAVGAYLIEQGATATVHVAAGLGHIDLLTEMLEASPELIDAPGCDGCTPLHFARNIETAQLLLSRGARIDARDEDHDSTPAQWLIGPSPDVAAYLITRGAKSDLFLAAALGDRTIADQHIAADRACLGHWIGKMPWHPLGHQGRGGTIYQWTLGFNSFAPQIATNRGHTDFANYLLSESDETTQFLVACVTADRSRAMQLLSQDPTLVTRLDSIDRELLARYCWETNVNLPAVELMLDCGFAVDYPETSHGYTPLHNAAWGGYGDLVDLLLTRGHPVSLRDPTYNSTPLGFALHCCLQDGRHPEGEYRRVVAALLSAGSPWDRSIYPTGNSAIDAALKAFMPGEIP